MPIIHQTNLQKETKPAVLAMIVANKSFTEISETLGISRKTLFNWRQEDPDFKKIYDSYLDTCVDTSNAMIKELVEDIYDTLHDLLKNGSEMARLGAAKELINQLNKLTSKISPANAYVYKTRESDEYERIVEVMELLDHFYNKASIPTREKLYELKMSKHILSSSSTSNFNDQPAPAPPPESLQKQGY